MQEVLMKMELYQRHIHTRFDSLVGRDKTVHQRQGGWRMKAGLDVDVNEGIRFNWIANGVYLFLPTHIILLGQIYRFNAVIRSE